MRTKETDLQHRVLVNGDLPISSADQQVALSLAEKNKTKVFNLATEGSVDGFCTTPTLDEGAGGNRAR